MTKVVNLYKEKYDVYIGRKGRFSADHYFGYFGNPFVMKNESERNSVIEKYKVYFYDRLKTDPEFKKKVLELKDKTLGCFCAPKLCHGMVIAEYLNNLK